VIAAMPADPVAEAIAAVVEAVEEEPVHEDPLGDAPTADAEEVVA
jgi:hypothetical protein